MAGEQSEGREEAMHRSDEQHSSREGQGLGGRGTESRGRVLSSRMGTTLGLQGLSPYLENVGLVCRYVVSKECIQVIGSDF